MAAARRGHVAALVVLVLLVTLAQDTHSKTVSPGHKIGGAFISALKSKRNAENSGEATTDSRHKLAELSFRDAIRVPMIDSTDDSMTSDDADLSAKQSTKRSRDHRKRRSAKQDYTPENTPNSADDSSTRLSSRQLGNSYPATVMTNIAGKLRDIMPGVLKNILDFVQIYRGFLSRYSPNLIKLLEMPSLEDEISRSEDLDYATNSGTNSDLSYGISKGKRLAELYSYNLNELLSLLRTGSRRVDDKTTPSSTVNTEGASGEVRGQTEGGFINLEESRMQADKRSLRAGSGIHVDSGQRRNSKNYPGIIDDAKGKNSFDFSRKSVYNKNEKLFHLSDDAFNPVANDPLERLFKDNEYFKAMGTGSASRNTLHNANHISDFDMSARMGPNDESDTEVEVDPANDSDDSKSNSSTSSQNKDIGIHVAESDKLPTNRSSVDSALTPSFRSEETTQTDIGSRIETINVSKTAMERNSTDKPLQEISNSSSISASQPEKKMQAERTSSSGQKLYRQPLVTSELNTYTNSKVPSYPLSKTGAPSISGRRRSPWNVRGKRGTNLAEYGVRNSEEAVIGVLKENNVPYGDAGFRTDRTVGGEGVSIAKRAVGTSGLSTAADYAEYADNVSKESPLQTNREKRGAAASNQGIGGYGRPLGVAKSNRPIDRASGTGRDYYGSGWKQQPSRVSSSARRNFQPNTGETGTTFTGFRPGTNFPNVQSSPPQWLNTATMSHSTDKIGSDNLSISSGSPNINSADTKQLIDNLMEAAAVQKDISSLLYQLSTISEGKTSHPEINIQYAALGKERANELSSTEIKAQKSVNTILSNFVIQLNNILESYGGNVATNVNQARLLILALSQHRLLNTLLYKNLVHLGSFLDGTSNMRFLEPSGIYRDRTPVRTGQNSDFLMPRMLETNTESSEEKEEKNATVIDSGTNFKQTDISNSSEEIISNNDLESRMFSIGDIAVDKDEQVSSRGLKDNRRPSAPFSKHSGSFAAKAPNKRPTSNRFLNTPNPQKEAWKNRALPPGFMHSYQRNVGDLADGSDGNSDTGDTAEEDKATADEKENKNESETADESGGKQEEQNSSESNENLSSIKELLEGVGIDISHFAEEDLQKISIMSKKIANDTLKNYVETQKSVTAETSSASTTLPCADSSSPKADTSSLQQSPTKGDSAAPIGGQENTSKGPLNTELTYYATAIKFLQSKGLLKKLHINEIRSLCKALVENSGRYAGDWLNNRESFSAVLLDFILRLFDSVETAYQKHQTGHTRARRHDAQAAPRRDNEDDKPEPRFSQGFPQPPAYSWDVRSSATWELNSLVYSNEADPSFLLSFFKHCQFENNGILKCTPTGVEYKGKFPKEIYLLLKYRAGSSIIPQSCPLLFGVH